MPERQAPQTSTSAAKSNPASAHHASTPNFEVERKYRLQDSELGVVREQLVQMGFSQGRLIAMTDQFLPVKVKGEMLRIRDEVVNFESVTLLTIKEWVNIAGGRERRETEGQLSALTRRFLLALGVLLNGGKLMSFSKQRQEHHNASMPGVVITLDDVSGLGKHSGRYAEIEVLVPQDGDVESARAQIAQLARTVFDEERAPVEMSYQLMLEDSLR
ncbi:CYTH domain-containing protein [bacterium]|nr:CYTH domain-containing protein [bacterium]